MSEFPSLKARRLLALLMRQPLNYREIRRSGSHRRLAAPGRPTITFSFHDRATVPGAVVRDVLCRQVGLTEDQAKDLL